MLTSVPLVGGTPKGTLVQVMNPETIAGMIQSNSAVEDSTTVDVYKRQVLICENGVAVYRQCGLLPANVLFAER